MIKEIFPGYNRGECRGDFKNFKFNSKKSAVTMAMCGRCTVQDACRTYARAHESYGIWAGENEADRKKIRKELGIPQPPLLGYYNPIGPVSVYINRERSNKRMKDMKWRRANQL